MSSLSDQQCHAEGAQRPRNRLRARARSRFLAALGMTVVVLGCERENRRFQENPPTATPTSTAVVVSDLQPGPAMVIPSVEAPYDDNAWAVSEGKSLFNSMNCSG